MFENLSGFTVINALIALKPKAGICYDDFITSGFAKSYRRPVLQSYYERKKNVMFG